MHRFSLFAAALAALLVFVATASSAQLPAPASPAAAKALAEAPGLGPGTATPVRVSPAAAYAAASLPGAVTEGGPATSPGRYQPRRTRSLASSTACWFVTAPFSRGTWPYDRHVYQNTWWCATYGWAITYRSTTMTYGATLCSGHDPYSFRSSGGYGYFYVEVDGGTYFDCPTDIPWLTYHFNTWIKWAYNAVGSAYPTNWSGT